MDTTPQVSGKVFRFLSAMHPSLSKSERKRYAGFDPDKWYPWTSEVSAEFTDLMRRSPRDTSFARGLTYVAQRAVPEGCYIPTAVLLENLARLPAAFRGPEGSGYSATVDRPGHATVVYTGMPGFANVCIAVQGELTQRLQASGAQSVVVKHGPSCRVNGDASCEFEVEWAGEAVPSDAEPANLHDLVGETADEAPGEPVARGERSVPEAGGRRSQAVAAVEGSPPAASRDQRAAPASGSAASRVEGASAAGSEAEASGFGPGLTSDDLFVQLRKRLAEADRHAQLFTDAQQEIDRLRLELSRVRAQAQAEVAQAEKERDEAVEALDTLKRRIRTIVSSD